ncbi:MAG TPA: hypothetical protein VN934_12110 [Candidatus Tumulicola sp.]|nr:hypothetical protein [Candidatus Tumulicola sp.]
MKRSSFLWLSAAFAAFAALCTQTRYVVFRASAASSERLDITPGRCASGRRLSRWSGYTLEQMAA